jgi:hypothetical protein
VKVKPKRLLFALLVGLAVIAGGSLLALHFAARTLAGQVQRALGENSEVGEIVLGWSAIEVRGLRIHAPRGWPAADTLRADRIVIKPDLDSLLAGRIGIASIAVEGAYLSALRSPDGRLRVVPSLIGGGGNGGPGQPVTIGSVELEGAAIEFFDATVRKPPLKIRLEQIQARLTDLRLPDLSGHSELKVEGILKGAGRDGRLSIDGWIELATRDSALASRLRNVDLVTLQPYLIRAAESGVKKGSLDLELQTTVRGGHLHGPGTLTLSGLELDNRGSTFMGLPRQAVIGFLKDRSDRISVKFVLDGNLDDPRFKLNENLSTRIASSFAETLGISFEGIVRGAGTVGEKSLEAVGGAAKGVGNALKGLFGK